MLKNYFKIAWRNLWKNKIISAINIFGLSVGIAFALLIGAYVWGELQVNRQLKDADNQYIIQSKWKDPNMGPDFTSIAELPRALKNNYAGLVSNYYHYDLITTNVSKGDKHFRENVQIGDSTLLNMYGFKLLYGDPKTALSAPFSVVITDRIAIKYFGKADIVGQSINLENFSGGKHDFVISGVLSPVAQNSVTRLTKWTSDFFLTGSAAQYFNRSLDGWDSRYIVDYVELRKGADPKAVDEAMLQLLKKNSSEQISKNLTPYLLSLQDYYRNGNGGLVTKMTYTLTYISLFILLMAVINFVNICIGRSSGRMREIGIRKVLGGLRKQLIGQFLTESILMVMLSTLIALAIYLLARPYFSNVLGKDITGLFSFPLYFFPVVFLFALMVGLLSGIYPALVLSALKSIDSLKGRLSSVKESVLFRKSLVAFQFTTAATVFIGAFIISQQVNLFFSSNLGYNKDYIMTAKLPRDWSPKGVQKMERIRSQLAQMPSVTAVALSYEIPDGNNGGNYPAYRLGTNPAGAISAQNLVNDNQFAATYGIPLKAGTYFKPGDFRLADTSQLVINETASKALGWNDPANAIGQKLVFQGVDFTICGVTADFHFGSMQDKIQPMVFTNVNWNTSYRFFSIKLKPGNIQQNLSALQKKWAQLMPGAPFEYDFMDETLKQLYTSEIQLKKAAYIATGLATVIVLLGVLGLVSLSIQKRIREIGIRKVLGSSTAGITVLFLKDFLGVVLFAGLIACPVAYLIMHHWLNDYAYKISISLTPFIFSILALTLITTCLIFLQTIKAALSNPVKSLRSE